MSSPAVLAKLEELRSQKQKNEQYQERQKEKQDLQNQIALLQQKLNTI